MKKIAALIAILLVITVPLGRPIASISHEMCVTAIYKAGERYARDMFGGDTHAVEIAAWNDAMCASGESEWMANVVLVVTLSGGGMRVAVIHLHLTQDGMPLFAGSFYNDTWHTLDDPGNWKKFWCEAIKSVYPSDARDFGCTR